MSANRLLSKRRQLFEVHDFSWCPDTVRNGLTDFLQAFIDRQDVYGPIRERLLTAVKLSHSSAIVDLCSGAGGPWLRWIREGRTSLPVTLTDKYPNRRTVRSLNASAIPGLNYHDGSVDATNVPPHLRGFRTIFTGFHHLTASQARDVISHAVQSRQGIAIVEFTRRSIAQLFQMLLTPLGVLLLMPRVPQVTWRALVLTYVLPVIPFVSCIDGILSCLRSYTPSELKAIANAPGYRWDAGEAGNIVYLIGHPLPGAPATR